MEAPLRWIREVAFRLRALVHPVRMERELDEEFEFHLEMATQKLIRSGVPPAEARRRARKRFGSPRRQKDMARWSWGLAFLRDLVADARLLGRQLRRDPAFALGAIVTLALGIGANTAIFSVFDQALLREPPVADGRRLASVYTTCRRGPPRCSSSWPDYVDYRDRTATIADLAAYSPVPLSVGDGTTTRLATGLLVTGNYFSLLGVGAELGRPIQPADNPPLAGAHIAVLSHAYWTSSFGADPDVVGRTVRLNGAPFEVVGVAPEGFRGLSLAQEADVFMPLFAGPALGPGVGSAADPNVVEERNNRWIGALVGRLAPGATHAQAQVEMDVLAAALGDRYPEERASIGGFRGITLDPLDGYVLPNGSEGDLRRFVFMLLSVVAITLLLASANLANLQLARGTSRSREIGVRMAVGAGRRRVLRQLLTESLLLSLVGGALGLLVAVGMLHAISTFQLPGGVVIGDLGVGLDTDALAFTFAVALGAAVLFGLMPAVQASRHDLSGAVKGETRSGTGHRVLRKVLVAVQVALCLVLLVGSGLFLRTLRNSLDADLGFEPSGVVTARFNLSLLGYPEERAQTFARDLLDDVRTLPGVEAAGLSTLVPFQRGGSRGTFLEIEGYEPQPDEEIRTDWVLVTPGTFDALGMRVVEGRDIGETDATGAPVAVINRYTAERYWAGRSPIGSMFRLSGTPVEVVGVVENPIWQAIGEDPTPFVFLHQRQLPDLSESFYTLVVRTTGDAEALLPAIRERFQVLDPGLALTTLETMDDLIGAALMPQRMGTTLLSLLGGLALVLAAIGVYGVVNYTVSRQARDIGIRIAIGASGRRILGSVVGDMLVPIGAGLVAGAIAAWLLADLVEAFMYGVSAGDPLTFLAIGALLLAVAIGATLVPARSASRVDPVKVLKTE